MYWLISSFILVGLLFVGISNIDPNKIRCKLIGWLGVDDLVSKYYPLSRRVLAQEILTKNLVNIGVDVHFKEPHMILIYTRLNGGMIKEIPAHFDNMKQLQEVVGMLKAKFNTDIVSVDAPSGFNTDYFGRF